MDIPVAVHFSTSPTIPQSNVDNKIRRSRSSKFNTIKLLDQAKESSLFHKLVYSCLFTLALLPDAFFEQN